MSVWAYCRVSGESQVSGEGLPRQREACEQFAKSRGWEISDYFTDGGVSGTKGLSERPAFLRLLDTAKPGDTVIVEKLDRLARDLVTQENILADCERRDVRVISATEPEFGADDKTRTLIRQILGSFIEYEKKCIVEKLAIARQAIRERGEHCDGRFAFGRHPERPHEAATLARIVELRGNRLKDICAMLNAEGRATRMGGPWKIGTVAGILRRVASAA